MPETPDATTPDDAPIEVLESGGGGRLAREPRPRDPRRRRRRLLGGAGVLGLGVVGAAAFGAYWYSSTGPQPAEALPAGVLGYAAIDLDPSGEQKLAALSVLKKVPSIAEGLDLRGNPATLDVTHQVLDAALRAEDCDVAVDDVTGWLGDRGAIAAVPDGEEPAVVVVAQVSDADAARAGLAELAACGGAGEEIGFDLDGEWALVAQDQATVDRVVALREKGTLADDADFRDWTEAAGDPGVVQLYAGPEAGAWYADTVVSEFATWNLDYSQIEEQCPYPEDPVDQSASDPGAVGEPPATDVLEEWEKCYDRVYAELEENAEPSPQIVAMQEELRAFEGAAITLRFDGGAVEVETAGELDVLLPGSFGGTGGGAALQALPADTALAYSVGLGPGWLEELSGQALLPVGGFGALLGMGDLSEELEESTGLRLPEDAELLAGRTLAFALSGGTDVAAFESDDLAEVAGGLTVSGDPDPLVELLGRVGSKIPADERGIVATSAGDDAVAVGPNAAWRDRLLTDHGLGGVDGFDDVVENADEATVAFYLDLDAVRDWLPSIFDDDDEMIADLEAVARVGGSIWEADGIEHGLLRITTKD